MALPRHEREGGPKDLPAGDTEVAGEVTVTRADGTVETQPAYSREELERIIAAGNGRLRMNPWVQQRLKREAGE